MVVSGRFNRLDGSLMLRWSLEVVCFYSLGRSLAAWQMAFPLQKMDLTGCREINYS